MTEIKMIDSKLEEKTIQGEALNEYISSRVRLQGYIHKVRLMSSFAFVMIRTRRRLVQCVYLPEQAGFEGDILIEGACVFAEGLVVADQRSRTGYEVQLVDVEILAVPAKEFPLTINNKILDVGLENLLDYRPLTLRNEKERAVFKIQEGLGRGFRKFLCKQQFTEIHTPKIVFTGAEGGANVFSLDYFGKEVYLAQSPQFYKQMMVGVYERVFEIGPVYRAEKHDTSRHLNEYTSMDFEMGFISGFEEVMRMETGLLTYMMELLREEYAYEVDLLKVKLPDVKEIPAIPFMEAKQILEQKYGRTVKDFYDFEPEEEQLLGEYVMKECNSPFVFVTHYPTAKRPFYAMEDPNNRLYTLSFDLLFHGLEITTGGQRIHDYQSQIKKMQERGMDVEKFESYLMLHQYGVPPHGGLGLGLERLTMRLLGQQNVRLATLFPRDRTRVEP